MNTRTKFAPLSLTRVKTDFGVGRLGLGYPDSARLNAARALTLVCDSSNVAK